MKDDTKNTETQTQDENKLAKYMSSVQGKSLPNHISVTDHISSYQDFSIDSKENEMDGEKKSIKDKAKETLIECTKILDNRGDQYGDSKINFDSLAEIFSATLNRNKKRILVDGNIEIRGSDVAFFMVEFKRLRIENSIDPEKDDSAKDAMAYLALGNELKKDEAKLDKRNTN